MKRNTEGTNYCVSNYIFCKSKSLYDTLTSISFTVCSECI